MGGIPPTPPHAVAEAKRMYEAGTFSVEQILKKTGIAKTVLYRKVAMEGWVKTKVDAPRAIGDRAAPRVVVHQPKGVVREPLAGSKPVPFHSVPKGCCLFILGDMPGQMDQALTCARPGYPYCGAHAAETGGGQVETKKGQAAKALVRSLKKYIT
jgi:hypothetical protein